MYIESRKEIFILRQDKVAGSSRMEWIWDNYTLCQVFTFLGGKKSLCIWPYHSALAPDCVQCLFTSPPETDSVQLKNLPTPLLNKEIHNHVCVTKLTSEALLQCFLQNLLPFPFWQHAHQSHTCTPPLPTLISRALFFFCGRLVLFSNMCERGEIECFTKTPNDKLENNSNHFFESSLQQKRDNKKMYSNPYIFNINKFVK